MENESQQRSRAGLGVFLELGALALQPVEVQLPHPSADGAEREENEAPADQERNPVVGVAPDLERGIWADTANREQGCA